MSLRFGALVVVFASAPLWAQQPPPSPPPAGIIRGTVTAADTGKPLRGVDVRIAGGSIPAIAPRFVRTNEQGRYEITGLEAGRYSLTVFKNGYLSISYGQRRPGESGRPVEVSATPLENIDIAMPRGSVIVARITDRFGDPLRGVAVRAYQHRFINGERRLQQISTGGGLTDDRGEQRIYGVPPGEYYIAAAPPLGALASVRGDAETYHPGTVRTEEAQQINVGVGEEAYVAFSMVGMKRSRLSGVINGSAGGPLSNPRASLQMLYLGSGSSRLIPLAPDGSFNEENLPPGEYVIEVGTPEWAMHRVQLYGEDVTNLVITTKKAGAVHARVTFDGAQPPQEAVDIRPSFVGPACGLVGLGSSCGGGSVGLIQPVSPSDWTFNAQLVGRGVLRLRRPATWWLKAVTVDGTDVTDTPVELSALADKTVEIVLTQRRAEINGGVTDLRGQPARDYVVVLFPDDEAQWTPFSRFIAMARPDQEGRFKLSGVPPGRYLAAAVDYLEPGEERNPETLSRLRTSATSFSLSDGEARAINLKVTP
jgi:hypothetical protein